MAIFGRNKESKEEKEVRKAQEFLSSKGLTELEPDISIQVNNIALGLSGLGLMQTGMALSFAKAEEQAKVGYASAQVEQNWIIIKQQDDILKELRKLNENI